MYISDKRTGSVLKNAFVYLACALFCALFGAIYEMFSHEVYSYYMIYAFAIPLGLGAFPFLMIGLFGKKLPGRFSINAWNSGVAALTVGCLFKGVLEIYGTTNKLIIVYPLAAVLFMSIGLIAFLTRGEERMGEYENFNCGR